MMATYPTDVEIPLFWIRPERNRAALQETLESQVFRRSRESAARVRLDLRLISVDDIIVWGVPQSSRVYVAGQQVEPTSCFFHTKLMTFPAWQIDVWRHLTTQATLESIGFCTTVPLTANIVNNDKLVTALQDYSHDVSWLPTVRVPTRQFYMLRNLVDFGLEFPVVVKPASWGGGHGVTLAHTSSQLDSLLQLASASEQTMLVQPWLGPDTVDLRIYCIDRQPYRALARRPAPGAVVANHAQGGSYAEVDIPPALVQPATAVANAVGLPYVCVDFLDRDGRYWFSEIELDGAMGDVHDLEQAKFSAFRRHFERFVAAQTELAT